MAHIISNMLSCCLVRVHDGHCAGTDPDLSNVNPESLDPGTLNSTQNPSSLRA